VQKHALLALADHALLAAGAGRVAVAQGATDYS
jgi:hypothetical protein